jgi:hypothetical protein
MKLVNAIQERRGKASIEMNEEEEHETVAQCFVMKFALDLGEVEGELPAITLGMVGLASGLVDSDQKRKFFRSLPVIPPVIENFYLIRSLFDRWKYRHFLKNKKLHPETLELATSLEKSERWTSKAGRIIQFCNDQKTFYSESCKADDDFLFRITNNYHNTVVRPLLLPLLPDLISFVVSYTHRTSGHVKYNTLRHLLHDKFYCKSLQSAMKSVVANCRDCAMGSRLRTRPGPSENKPICPRGPGYKIVIDVYGPIRHPRDPHANDKPPYFLTTIDAFSKLVNIYPMNDASSSSVKLALLCYVQSFGFPSLIVSDSGASFCSLSQWAGRLGVEWKFTAPYHPQSHGLIERAHRDMGETLRASIDSNFWFEALFQRILVKNVGHADLVFKHTPQLAGSQANWESSEDLIEDETVRNYVRYWEGEKEKNREKMRSKGSLLKKSTFIAGDNVLVYKQPRSKFDTSWRKAVIKNTDGYGGYLLEDGTKVAGHNVKRNTESENVNFIEENSNEIIECGQLIEKENLVVFEENGTKVLAVVDNWTPEHDRGEVTVVKINEDFTVWPVKTIDVAGVGLTKIRGKFDVKRGQWSLPRSVTAELRILGGVLPPQEKM